MERVNRTEVLEIIKDNVVGLDDYNDIINFISTIAFEASHKYDQDGCKNLARRTANVATGLHDLLENIGYFDDIRGKKVI